MLTTDFTQGISVGAEVSWLGRLQGQRPNWMLLWVIRLNFFTSNMEAMMTLTSLVVRKVGYNLCVKHLEHRQSSKVSF